MDKWEEKWQADKERQEHAQRIVDFAASRAPASLRKTLTGKTQPDYMAYLTDAHRLWTDSAYGHLEYAQQHARKLGLTPRDIDEQISDKLIEDAKAAQATARKKELARKTEIHAGSAAPKRLIVERDHQGGFGMWFPRLVGMKGGTLNEVKALARAAGYTEMETRNRVSHRTTTVKVTKL